MIVSPRQYGSNALNEYDYSNDNAYVSPWEETKTEKKKPTVKVVRITKKTKIKITIKVLLLASMAFAVVFSYAVTSRANLTYLNSVKAVEEQQKINDDLRIQIADANYLTNIEEKAIEQNMFFPSSAQIKYIKLVNYEDIVKNDDAEEKDKKESKPWFLALFD